VPLGTGGDDDPLLPGMSGRARIDVQRTSIAGATARAARRLLRTDFLL
jgi:hypothetical protein